MWQTRVMGHRTLCGTRWKWGDMSRRLTQTLLIRTLATAVGVLVGGEHRTRVAQAGCASAACSVCHEPSSRSLPDVQTEIKLNDEENALTEVNDQLRKIRRELFVLPLTAGARFKVAGRLHNQASQRWDELLDPAQANGWKKSRPQNGPRSLQAPGGR